ncbi:uncharacterized protein LOC129590714 [Paramacrobiotus metropolitanus]|uniref:uncharacterized protein LOC129590714 n=1 Tax=Paramacrobiotus metropolitanus TaxID=2943436 RepID=UPI0024462459|nr:uncharacterized protein LOC129590714 [Paramacrobiotus metropolitanus]
MGSRSFVCREKPNVGLYGSRIVEENDCSCYTTRAYPHTDCRRYTNGPEPPHHPPAADFAIDKIAAKSTNSLLHHDPRSVGNHDTDCGKATKDFSTKSVSKPKEHNAGQQDLVEFPCDFALHMLKRLLHYGQQALNDKEQRILLGVGNGCKKPPRRCTMKELREYMWTELADRLSRCLERWKTNNFLQEKSLIQDREMLFIVCGILIRKRFGRKWALSYLTNRFWLKNAHQLPLADVFPKWKMKEIEKKKEKLKKTICWKFNLKQKCERRLCVKQHVCLKCGGQHPGADCQEPQNNLPNNVPAKERLF